MNTKEEVEREILRKAMLAGYGPTFELAMPMAAMFDQQVGGEWWYPRFGTDSLQHVLDVLVDARSFPLEADKKRESDLERMLCNVIDANYGADTHDIGNGDGLPENEAKEIAEFWRAHLDKIAKG